MGWSDAVRFGEAVGLSSQIGHHYRGMSYNYQYDKYVRLGQEASGDYSGNAWDGATLFASEKRLVFQVLCCSTHKRGEPLLVKIIAARFCPRCGIDMTLSSRESQKNCESHQCARSCKQELTAQSDGKSGGKQPLIRKYVQVSAVLK